MALLNTKENQKCWNCAHFQRYDQATENLTLECGECRAQPIKGQQRNVEWLEQFYPYIEEGTTFWCSKWKKTSLTPPPEPVGLQPATWPDVFEAFQLAPWNVWGTQKRCWECNHFQRLSDVPEPGKTKGWCRSNPMLPVMDLRVDLITDTLRGQKTEYDGLLYWCSCWERSNLPVADPDGA